MNRTNLLPRIAFVLILLGWLLACSMLTGCTTIQKVFHRQSAKVDSTVNTRTDSLAYHQKVVKEGYGLVVRYDTGCTNTFTFNPSTGFIQASGGVTEVSVDQSKTEAQTDSIRLIKQRQDRYITNTVTKTVEKTKKVVPWPVYLIGAVGAAFILYILYKKLNPISRFYPF